MRIIQNKQVPLAEKMRPKKLTDFVGQKKLVEECSFFRRAIEKDELMPFILWGPPGSGKTSLAFIISKETKADFVYLSAVESGVKRLRQILEKALENEKIGRKTILFLDEIHRWSKSQQDALLPGIEKGIIILIGATTENPSFELNSALLSRARILVLEKLGRNDLKLIIRRALKDKINGLGSLRMKLKAEIMDKIIDFSGGDARITLNILEACSKVSSCVDENSLKSVLQKSYLIYDRKGDEHYNIISALQKSMRGGNADASLYWLERMLVGGEDPLYVARRLVRFASEDIGLANNTALVLANACFDACLKIGMPECEVSLAQCVVYLAKSKKSIIVYEASKKAKEDVEKFGNLPIPLHLRNASNKFVKKMGWGKNYKYSPKENDSNQEYFPEKLKNKKYLK